MGKILNEISKLSVAERILLVEAIWDTIPSQHEKDEPGEKTKKILKNRLEGHKLHPDAGSQWETVKKRILKKL